MTTALRLIAILLVSCGMNLAVVDDADARRFGGGKSLGGRSGSMFNRSATRPRTPSQQAAFSKNQQARQQMSQRGGLMGMLGGLALGGLLGALFFGGAFENLNLLDFLLFGGIAFLLFKLMAARRHAPAGGGGGGDSPAHAGSARDVMARDAMAGDAASGRGDGAATPGSGTHLGVLPGSHGVDADFEETTASRGEPPADFDESTFLAGARRAFEILQQSWNDQDLSEIRGLTTDEMFAEIQDQVNAPDADAFVQVLKVEAELIDVRQIGTSQEAAVLFDAILRESDSDRPTQVREIWHFSRTAGALAPKWLLEGIEQLES